LDSVDEIISKHRQEWEGIEVMQVHYPVEHIRYPNKIDINVLDAFEASMSVQTMDDLFEVTLSHLLRMDHVRKVEVFLFDNQNNLVPVASASKSGPKGKEKQEVRAQSWLINSSVRHTSRRIAVPNIFPVYAIPLIDSDKPLGFLHAHVDQMPTAHRELRGNLYLAGLHLSNKIREMVLNNEIQNVKSELQSLVAINRENLQRVTSLSKELYAISAISTKINQSMNLSKSLKKSMAKIREVFKAIGALVYVKVPGSPKMKLSAMHMVGDDFDDVLRQKIEEFLSKEIVKINRPLAMGENPKYHQTQIVDLDDGKIQRVVGTPMQSKTKIIGALIILPESADTFNSESLRLLSGVANIMGMAIENMNLYRQSQQKKREAAFLVRSMAKFNEKLDLIATLKSVAEKGAEFIGKPCRVYLFSETRIPMIQVRNQKKRGSKLLSSRTFKKIQPKELEAFYRRTISQDRPALINNFSRSKKIGAQAKPYFQKKGIQSLITVPLKLMGKKVGLLVLSSEGKRTFDRHDLSVAEALGSAAAVAIENARAYSTSVEMSEFLEKKITQKTSQIQQIQERQKIRVENRMDIIFRVNKGNRFVFVNKAMETLSGCSKEELYRGDFRSEDVVAVEDRERVRDCFRRILRRELPIVKDLEYRHLNQKGDDHIVSLTVYPETDQYGRITGVEGVGRDITEKKRLEAELAKAKDLTLLGEFSSAVAHQIRNPLSNILMGTKRLQRALGMNGHVSGDGKQGDGTYGLFKPDRETLSHIFGNLSEGIHNLNQVVTELLEYTKTLKLSRSSQRLDIILKETLNMFQDLIQQSGIQVEETYDPRLPQLSVDAVLMGQVFQNVIHNSIQAMPDGGCLSLSAGFYRQRPGYTFISIRDNGTGIRPSELDKVFHPFYTTKDSGTGLGLSLAHRIIEAHKGMMWVCMNPCPHFVTKPVELIIGARKAPSKGATIHILLPIDNVPTRQRGSGN
jgi:PAS domain S-box-containing protein